MTGRAAHLQQTIKQGADLVADNHFGAEKIKERIQDIQVPESSRWNCYWLETCLFLTYISNTANITGDGFHWK